MTVEEAAAEIRELEAVRPRGGGTKLGWGPPSDAPDFDTRRLNRILEHNVGDFTAVLEAGVPLVEAQATFAAEGQMLALDPPLGEGDAATIGGVIATNDSGPLRHRYGGVRDLVVGMTVVLSDGTIAKSGGKVIKNVAGYDLAKLFAGSYGTLGLIASVAVRLHPAPPRTATARLRQRLAGASSRARGRAGRGAAARGRVLRRQSGRATRLAEPPVRRRDRRRAGGRGGRARRRSADWSLDEDEDDVDDWALHRDAQRSADGFVVKVAGRPTDLPAVIREARRAGGTRRLARGARAVVDPPARRRRRRRAPRGARPARLHGARRRRPRGDAVAGRRSGRARGHGADQGALRPRSGVQAGHIRGRTVR